MHYYDYIIIGSGIAGLYTALLAREYGSVLILTKGSIDDCNTRHAQGGIAAATGKDDSPQLHFQDTVQAGNGLCDLETTHILTDEATSCIADLVGFGVPFDTLNGEVSLAREGAHSAPRVLHAGGDATGEYIETALSSRVYSSNIRVLEYCLATRLLLSKGRVTGVKALDCRTGLEEEYRCRYLSMATGGVGQLFKYTANSSVVTGDGIALAVRAGAEASDMEFFQFHPTVLRLPGVVPFLISEAVRGEGGVLRNAAGYRFMPDYVPEAEMAPRDVVARSILYEMTKTGDDKVFLDVTHLPPHLVTARFPHIYRFCLGCGLDITREYIPVAPAAHYLMGGIRTNSWGETSLPGLFASGETACTGVHGANRLASNSLLESVVFSKRVIRRSQMLEKKDCVWHEGKTPEDKNVYLALPSRSALPEVPSLNLSKLQSLMWDKVGIVRSGSGLGEATGFLAAWERILQPPSDRFSHELNNLILCARLMAEAALFREESRGAHFRTDFPHSSPAWLKHIIFKKDISGER